MPRRPGYSGGSACFLGAVGDALGLFTDVADKGPAAPGELAVLSGVDARNAAEWLAGVHAAGDVTFDTATGRYELPDHHVLAGRGDPERAGIRLGLRTVSVPIQPEATDGGAA